MGRHLFGGWAGLVTYDPYRPLLDGPPTSNEKAWLQVEHRRWLFYL